MSAASHARTCHVPEQQTVVVVVVAVVVAVVIVVIVVVIVIVGGGGLRHAVAACAWIAAGLHWTGLDWTGLQWRTGLDSTGRAGLDWTRPTGRAGLDHLCATVAVTQRARLFEIADVRKLLLSANRMVPGDPFVVMVTTSATHATKQH